MIVMIDTNIFISSVLFPNGQAAAALRKSFLPPFVPITCDYVIDELHQVFQKKFLDSLVTHPHIISVSDFLKL